MSTLIAFGIVFLLAILLVMSRFWMVFIGFKAQYKGFCANVLYDPYDEVYYGVIRRCKTARRLNSVLVFESKGLLGVKGSMRQVVDDYLGEAQHDKP